MTSANSNWVKRHPLASYFVLAYAITGGIGILLAASLRGLIGAHIPPSAHFLAAYGPMLAALIVTGISDRATGIRELVGRMSRGELACAGFSWPYSAQLRCT